MLKDGNTFKFQFNAPSYCDLKMIEKHTDNYQLDIQKDKWFLYQHPELELMPIIQTKPSQQNKVQFIERLKQPKQQNIIKQNRLHVKALKLSLPSKDIKPKKQSKTIAKTSRSVKTQAQVLNTMPLKKIPPPPCPYPPRIQRKWQNTSNKHWYQLSQKSRTNAEKSMKKLNDKK